MAATVRDGASGRVEMDDHDGAASDGEMDMDVEADSDVQHGRDAADGDAAGDNEYALLTRITDTSAAEARAGKDIQGIPWERLQITRQDYRKARLEQYKNYENFPQSGELMDKLCKQVEGNSKYYEFQYNTRVVKPSILHFQSSTLAAASVSLQAGAAASPWHRRLFLPAPDLLLHRLLLLIFSSTGCCSCSEAPQPAAATSVMLLRWRLLLLLVLD